MKRSGVCIISFDCEGNWGMADHLSCDVRQRLTAANLLESYQQITRVLDDYQVSATFAFVACFTLAPDYFIEHYLPQLNSQAHRKWLKDLFIDLNSKDFEGWFHPELFDLVKGTRVNHEIASHGFTHLPFDHPDRNGHSDQIEMDGILDWKKREDVDLNTFVFPRNIVGALEALQEVGMIGYRKPPTIVGSSIFNRFCRLMREFIPFESSEKADCSNGRLVAIPGGFFLNWRSGFRALVPLSITLKRLNTALLHASKTGGVVHLWLHPHNLIAGRQQMELFEKSIAMIAHFEQVGLIQISTQVSYALSQLQAKGVVGHLVS